MDNVTNIFDEQSKHQFRNLSGPAADQDNFAAPWKAVPQNSAPPPLFNLHFLSGQQIAFAYSDLREIRCPHAGRLHLYVLRMARYVITLEGRHLRDLGKLFGAHKVLRVQEGDPRETGKPEQAPEIVKITIEELAG